MTTTQQLRPTPSHDEFVRRLRREISDLDRALVDIINRRLRMVTMMKRYKDEHYFDFVDLSREEWMLQYLRRANRGPLSTKGLDELYHHLLALMKREVLAPRTEGEA